MDEPTELQAKEVTHPVHDELNFNTTPNYLTLLRILFVPFVVGLLFIQTFTGDLIAALVFAVASITDYFDGYLARTQQVVTIYGKLLDPLADKFLVVSALVMLQYIGRIHPVVIILLICRELAITGLRALASAEGVIIDASGGGKLKTVAQMVAIPLIMVQRLFGFPLLTLGMVLLYISLALSLWSAKDYAVDFFRAIREQRKIKKQEKKKLRELKRAQKAAQRAAKIAAKKAARKKKNKF